MSNNPIDNRFPPSFPPWTTPSRAQVPSFGDIYGQRLFDDVTAFYSWYVSAWYLSSGEFVSSESSQKNDTTRKILSLIKRIAEVSMSGGGFLSEKEESRALDGLSEILQDLNNGSLRKQQLPEALLQLADTLTANNPKAKLVSQTTELEYLFCINPSPMQSTDLTQKYQQLFTLIIEKINPQMRDINASAISRGLSQILENPHRSADMSGKIHEAIKHWL